VQSLREARSRGARTAAVVAAIVAVGTAGCSSAGSSSSSPSSGASANATAELTASVSRMTDEQQIKTYAASISWQASSTPGSGSSESFSLSGTSQSQRQPTQLTGLDVSSIKALGLNMGSMSAVVTPTILYINLPILSAAAGKPWAEMPFSETTGTGLGLSQLLGDAQNVDPLSSAALLAGATDVRTIGTGSVDGVPVTELSGSEPASAGLAKTPVSMRAPLGKEISQLGIGQVTFQVWIDGQHDIRKEIVTESGSKFTETKSFTITSINQPVSISTPPASQVAAIPASVLNMAGL